MPPKWLIRRIDRPTSRFTAALPLIATLLILYGTRFPTIYAAETLLGIVLWVAFLIGHLPAAFIRYFWLKKNIIKPSTDRRRQSLVLRTIVGLSVSITLLYIPLPAFLFFWIYRSDFDKLANQSLSMPYFASSIFDARVGPYLIQRADRCPHGIEFDIDLPYWQQPNYPSGRQQATFVMKNEPGKCRNHAELDWHLAGDWYTGKPE